MNQQMVAAMTLAREFDSCAALAKFRGDDLAAMVNGGFAIGGRFGADEFAESFEHGGLAGAGGAQEARHQDAIGIGGHLFMSRRW